MQILMALMAGLIFGIGLIVSGMTNPAKVIGFLDLAGNWDPSLAFVMGGAIAGMHYTAMAAVVCRSGVPGTPMTGLRRNGSSMPGTRSLHPDSSMFTVISRAASKKCRSRKICCKWALPRS